MTSLVFIAFCRIGRTLIDIYGKKCKMQNAKCKNKIKNLKKATNKPPEAREKGVIDICYSLSHKQLTVWEGDGSFF